MAFEKILEQLEQKEAEALVRASNWYHAIAAIFGTVAVVIARCQTANLAPNCAERGSPVASLRLGAAAVTYRAVWRARGSLPSNSNNFLHAAFFRCANSPFIGEYRRNSVEGSLLGDEEG
jgi:hypothetical protein